MSLKQKDDGNYSSDISKYNKNLKNVNSTNGKLNNSRQKVVGNLRKFDKFDMNDQPRSKSINCDQKN